MNVIGVTDQSVNVNRHLRPLITVGLIEMTNPDKPTSGSQRYRLTDAGQAWLDCHADSAEPDRVLARSHQDGSLSPDLELTVEEAFARLPDISDIDVDFPRSRELPRT